MKKIEKLTPEQEAKFPEYIQKWTDIGLCTEPADRPRAERAIKLMYETAGLKPPKIIWCDSPLGNVLTSKIARDSVWASVRTSVWASVRTSVGDSVLNSVGDSVLNSVWASVRTSVLNSVGDSVGASVRDSVRDSVWDSVGDSVGDSVWDSICGQHDADWLAFYDFFRNECGLVKETEKLQGLWELCQSAGWALPYENVCFISERHNVLKRDDRGRLHCEDGPAVAYPDGFSIYAWHGVRVPERIIIHPETITPEEITQEQNAEIRRVMLEKFGRERFLELPSCRKIHSDDYGTLYRNDSIRDVNNDPYCFVKVVNSTPEPDGSYKDYILRVSPNCKTAKEAVQSTFPRIRDFAPMVES